MLKDIKGPLKSIKVLRETDKYTLYAVEIGEVSLTTFDKGISDHFKIGEMVIGEYEETEKYKTLKSLKEYSEESEKKQEEYLNSQNQELDIKVKELLGQDILKTPFSYKGESFEIIIRKI